MGRKGKHNFGGRVPLVFKVCNNSHVKSWLAFKKQRRISGPLTIENLRNFAAFLLGRFKYSSTNDYLSSDVSFEGASVRQGLVERNYSCLRGAVTRYLKKEKLGG